MGISTLRQCIITQQCKGTLSKQLSNNTKVIPVSVPGLQDWEQRAALFTYAQTLPTKNWVFTHNMGLVPVLQVYINAIINGKTTLVPTISYKMTVLSPYQVQIVFNQQHTGVVQCISSNAIPINPMQITAPSSSMSVSTSVSNNGIVTVGILDSIQPQSTHITFITPTGSKTIQYKYLPDPSIESPWHDFYNILVNNKIYNIYTIDLNGLNIQPGSVITFFDINDVLLNGTQLVILMANPPFTNNDKIVNSAIFAQSNAPQLIYNNQVIYGVNSYIQSVFPYIIESQYSTYSILPKNSSVAIQPIPKYIGLVVSNVDELMQQYTLFPDNWNVSVLPTLTGFMEIQLSPTDVAQITTTPSFNSTLLKLLTSANNNQIATFNLVGNVTWLQQQNSATVTTFIEQLSDLPFAKLVVDVQPQNGPGVTLSDNLNLLLGLITEIESVNILPLWIVLDYTVIAPGWINGTPNFSSVINALYQLNVQGIVIKFYSTNTSQQIQFMQALLSTYPQMLFLLQITVDPALPPSESYAEYNTTSILSNITTLYTSLTSLGFNGIIINSWNEYFTISNPVTTLIA
jgi:hypothetical protein